MKNSTVTFFSMDQMRDMKVLRRKPKKGVEEPLRSKEKDMINNAAVVPKGNLDVPQCTENLLFGGEE
jgi:hypothetical protein